MLNFLVDENVDQAHIRHNTDDGGQALSEELR